MNGIVLTAILLMPWLAMVCVLVFPRRLTLIREVSGDSRANVSIFALVPTLVLAFHAVGQPVPMDWIEPLFLVLAGGAIMTIAAVMLSRASARRDSTLIFMGIVMFASFSVYSVPRR